jgi:hypothetical protein
MEAFQTWMNQNLKMYYLHPFVRGSKSYIANNDNTTYTKFSLCVHVRNLICPSSPCLPKMTKLRKCTADLRCCFVFSVPSYRNLRAIYKRGLYVTTFQHPVLKYMEWHRNQISHNIYNKRKAWGWRGQHWLKMPWIWVLITQAGNYLPENKFIWWAYSSTTLNSDDFKFSFLKIVGL